MSGQLLQVSTNQGHIVEVVLSPQIQKVHFSFILNSMKTCLTEIFHSKRITTISPPKKIIQ